MGIIQDLKNIMLGKAKRENLAMAQMMNGTIPIFSVGGNDYYINDIVQQCVSCFVNEMVKLNPMHVRGEVPFWGPGSINNVLEVPNEYMTKSDFLEKVTWNLMVDYNSFILPAYTAFLDANGVKKRRYSAMYPVRPQNVVYLTDDTGTLYVRMKFNRFAGDGIQEITVPYNDVIHIRYSYGANEMFGGDSGGRPDRRALLRTLDLNNRLLDGVAKGVEASYGINGIVNYRGVINAEATRQAVIEFENFAIQIIAPVLWSWTILLPTRQYRLMPNLWTKTRWSLSKAKFLGQWEFPPQFSAGITLKPNTRRSTRQKSNHWF